VAKLQSSSYVGLDHYGSEPFKSKKLISFRSKLDFGWRKYTLTLALHVHCPD